MSFVASAVISGVGSVVGGVTSLIGGGKAADAAGDANAASVAEQRRQYDQTREDFQPYREVGRGALSSLADIYGVARPSGPAREFTNELVSPVAMPSFWTKGQAKWDLYVKNMLANPDYKTTGSKRYRTKLKKYLTDNLNRQTFDYENPNSIYAGGTGVPAGTAPGTTGTAPAAPVDRTGGFYASPGYQFRLDEGSKAIQRSAAARGKLFSGDALKSVEGYAQGVASDEFARHVSGLQSLAGVGQSATGSTAAAGGNAANAITNSNMNSAAIRGSSYMAGAEGINNAVQGGIGNYLMYRYLRP